MELKKYKLGECLELQRGYDLTSSQMQGGEVEVVGSNGIIGYHNSERGNSPCITVGRSGSVGKVHYYEQPTWAHNTALFIKDFKGNNPKYLYYLLKNLHLDNIFEKGSSVIPSLDRKLVHSLVVPFHKDINDQRKVVDVLSAIDRKIELNKQINDNLEAMARQLYDYWFVQFDFPNEEGKPYKSSGGAMVWNEKLKREIPEEWKTANVFDPGPPVSWNDPSNPDDPQAGYGYIPNDTTKEETFFYHSDHLGSTSYITDDKANITQYDAYLPYGELLVDEHSSSEDLPYKFNGKQFDEETGLYYYGARYMNPMASIWYGVDPLAEKYVTAGGYIYTLENPINLVDPDGNKVIPKLYVNDSKKPVSYYRSPKNFSKAMKAFAKTTYGKKVLADFTEKGKTIFGVKGNGKYAKFDLVLDEEAFTDQQIRTAKFLDNDGSWIAAQTQMSKDQDGKPQFTIIFDLSYSSDELTETVTHEFSVHLSRYSGVLDTYMKTDNYKAAEKIWKNLSGNDEHHDLIRRSPKLPGSKLYYKTASELIGQNKKLKSIFNDASKYHKKHY